MTLSEAVDRVCALTNKKSTITEVKTRIIGHINDVCQHSWDHFDWSFRNREYFIATKAKVTSGTVTATQDSRTVTASGTPFDTTEHKDWFIRFTGDSTQALYRVINVPSTSTLTISPAYQGTTGAGKAYELLKLDYTLPNEVEDVESIKVYASGRLIPVVGLETLDLYQPMPIRQGSPLLAGIFKSTHTPVVYSTGTVTGTINTNTLTGSGTAWLDNVSAGDTITIGSYKYTVASVESDTALTLYNFLKLAASASTYTATRQFNRVLRLPPAADARYVFSIRGLRKYAPLVNDSDSNELLYRCQKAVIAEAAEQEFMASPDQRSDAEFLKAQQLWDECRAKDRTMTSRMSSGSIHSYRQ